MPAPDDQQNCALDDDVDPLTNLPWSLAAELFLHDAADAIRTRSDITAVIAVDIDDFAAINATYGTAAGDEVLQVVARRLDACPGARAFRIDADVFVLLVESVGSRLDAVALAATIQARVAQPCFVNGEIIGFTVTVGIRLLLDGTDDPPAFLADAIAEIRRTKRYAAGIISLWYPGK